MATVYGMVSCGITRLFPINFTFAAARLHRVASLDYEIYNYNSSGKFNYLLLNKKSVKTRDTIARERGKKKQETRNK